MILIVTASTILQFAAGFLALRLIAYSGRSWAWTLLSAGIFSMAFRRTHTLYQIYRNGTVPTLPYELLGLAISILIFLGIYLITPLLRDMRKANEDLAESEERYRTVAEFTHDWEYWFGPDGKFLYVSPACERITGHTPQEFLDNPLLFQEIIHPDDKEFVLKRISTLENMRTPQSFDYRIVDAHGATRWVARNSFPVFTEDGLFLGLRASIRDIDHRKALEQKLRDNQTLYQGLVENSRSMVLRLDSQGTVTFANGYAIKHLGIKEKNILGLHLSEILATETDTDGIKAQEQIKAFTTTGKRLELEVEFCKPDGTVAWSEWVGSSIRHEHCDISEFICVGIDVSRRKALDKLKEDVTRIIRHDLKSPLSGIIGIPHLLMQDDNLTPHQKELLGAVKDAGTIMLDLINQSLNLYKLETGTYKFHIEEFNLLTLLDEIGQHIQIDHEKKIPIHISLDGKPAGRDLNIPLRAERPLIFSMLCNLLRNALESNEGQPVTVDISKNGEYRLCIRNAGIVPEAIQDTFFDKYVTRGKSGGTGLGTYSARLIARQHGGDITMRSTRSEGTTLIITLPKCPPNETAGEPSA